MCLGCIVYLCWKFLLNILSFINVRNVLCVHSVKKHNNTGSQKLNSDRKIALSTDEHLTRAEWRLAEDIYLSVLSNVWKTIDNNWCQPFFELAIKQIVKHKYLLGGKPNYFCLTNIKNYYATTKAYHSLKKEQMSPVVYPGGARLAPPKTFSCVRHWMSLSTTLKEYSSIT